MSVKNLIELRKENAQLNVVVKNKKYFFNINYFMHLKYFEKYISDITNDLINIATCNNLTLSYSIDIKELLNFRLSYEFDNINEKLQNYHIKITCNRIVPIDLDNKCPALHIT